LGDVQPKSVLKAPRDCVDYLINHELCHLKSTITARTVTSLLETLMPDWERYKQALDGLAEMPLNR